jgi:hypothetical protein
MSGTSGVRCLSSSAGIRRITNLGRITNTSIIQRIPKQDDANEQDQPLELLEFLENPEHERSAGAKEWIQAKMQEEKPWNKKAPVHEIEIGPRTLHKSVSIAQNLRVLGEQLEKLFNRVRDIEIYVCDISALHPGKTHLAEIICKDSKDFLKVCVDLIPNPKFNEYGMDGWVTHEHLKIAYHVFDKSSFKFSKNRIPNMWSGCKRVPLENVVSKEIAKIVEGNARKEFKVEDPRMIYGDLNPDLVAQLHLLEEESEEDDESD